MSNIVVVDALPTPSSAPVTNLDTAQNRHQLLSGIEINQNQQPTLGTDSLLPAGASQTFKLPPTYERSGNVIPGITGVQICTSITPGNTDFSNIQKFNYTLTALDTLTTSDSRIHSTSIWY